MSAGAATRFWTEVSVVPDPAGWAVRLDNKPVRLPEGGALVLPGRVLAEAVAAEWRDAGGGSAGGGYGADALPMTRLAGTMLARVAPRRDPVIGTLLGFLDNDALCYRAAHPAPLVARQAAEWQPWLDWCKATLGADLAATRGIMPIRQPEAAHAAIARVLQAQDDAGLAALGVLAPTLGSLVLALACVSGVLAAADAHRLSILDDRFQREQWGEDREAEDRHRRMLADCTDAERFLHLARAAAIHLLIEGRVQGVGYRVWMQREATALALRGWVRNLADGRVEALLCGSRAALSRLAALARQGPRMAQVRAVVETETVGDGTVGPDVQISPTADVPHDPNRPESAIIV